jgi:Exo-beta-D-glucosaminidase Ig-fold domain/Glycosyl hydrolases family 2/Glycosyl hydrolases family 2, sugar binding domain
MDHGVAMVMKCVGSARGMWIALAIVVLLMTSAAQSFGDESIEPKAAADPRSGGKLELNSNWKLQNSKFLPATPEQIASPNFDDSKWIQATVPGTVLTSYINTGAVPDPFYSDQRFQVSDDFFTNHDFWFRNSFIIPDSFSGKIIWLNFDGINWKAEVFVNAHPVGRIDGAFIRGRFDVTPFVQPGKSNCIAVLIRKVAHPGTMHTKSLKHWDPNGGALGLDSPTFLASVGWNWLPTIPGREIGIWNKVYLSTTGDVSLNDPFVAADLPDTSRADLTVRVDVQNHSSHPIQGLLRGWIGDLQFTQPVSLDALATRQIVINQLSIDHPRLWWPNGMGEQAMYSLDLKFEIAGKISDQKEIPFGIRKLTYEVRNNILFIYVNGHRVLIRGGNWGMPEGLLRCDREGYDHRVRLHKEMNFNMIRNWVGMTGNDEFYDACDKYGILIWDDFWLANPVDGPDPTDHAMFIANARDKVCRVRNHPSLALYCGRNEGVPPKDLDVAMRRATEELDGTRFYLSDSASGIVTGHGPYEMQAPEWYFANRGASLHSELGIVAVPPAESMRAMLPPEKLWPINDLWGLHDLSQARGPAYLAQIEKYYGQFGDLEDFCRKAQMLNMECSKAMLESWQSKQGSGCLIWMTQSAWPSLICQAYDYYFEPTAAYFGFKKACEPIHILWDSHTNEIKVANDTLSDLHNVTAEAEIYDFSGKQSWKRSAVIDVPSASARVCFPLEPPANLSAVYFIKLRLTGGGLLSDNFYWVGRKDHDYSSLDTLPKVTLSASVSRTVAGNQNFLLATISNPSASVGLMIRLKLVGAQSGRRVLPAFYEDNYFSLLPGETKTVRTEVDTKYLQNENPKLLCEGWNIVPAEIVLR